MNTATTYLSEVAGFVHRGESAAAMRSEEGYTLDAIEQVLDNVKPPQSLKDMEAFGVFAGYLVIDALVANTDRHSGNWALFEAEDGTRHLAPVFDHGSALGAGMTAENRASRDPIAFAACGRSNPFRKRGLVSLALEAVSRSGARIWLERVQELKREQVHQVLNAPGGRLSVADATFIESVILENQRRLCDDYRGKG